MRISTSVLIKNILIILLIALISPFIINCFFAYPQTDDFCYSFLPGYMGLLKTQYYVYSTWSGRFTSTALLTVNPLVYKSFTGYNLVFATLILAQFMAIYLLTDAITNKMVPRKDKLIFSLLFFFAFLDQMDDIRSGLYWMAGVVTYQVAETLLFLLVALILFIGSDPKYDNWFFKSVVIIIAILVCGTNEIVLVLTLLITALITCYDYAIQKRVNYFKFFTCIAAISGSSLLLSAPGNITRISEYHERKTLLLTAWNSFYGSIASIKVWVTSPLTLLLMSMVFLTIHRRPQLKRRFINFKILPALCLLLFMTFICFFIPNWGTGMHPQNRVLNMIYLFFMIGWMICLAVIFTRYEEPILNIIKKIPVKTGTFIAISYFIVLFYLGTSNFLMVSKDLLSGDSLRYNREMQQRTFQILNSDDDNCKLEGLTQTPPSLYFFFIDKDKEYWVNGCYASYFGKKSISLKDDRQNCFTH